MFKWEVQMRRSLVLLEIVQNIFKDPRCEGNGGVVRQIAL
jgi:hypothetical protein